MVAGEYQTNKKILAKWPTQACIVVTTEIVYLSIIVIVRKCSTDYLDSSNL